MRLFDDASMLQFLRGMSFERLLNGQIESLSPEVVKEFNDFLQITPKQ